MRAFLYDNGDALKFNAPGGGEVSISLNAGNAGSFSGMTQLASASTNVAIQQDGYALGVLNNINVDDQGIISGIYSNGVTKTLAQIAMANFTNEAGLQKKEIVFTLQMVLLVMLLLVGLVKITNLL